MREEDLQALVASGVANFQAGRYDKALRSFNEVLEVQPKNVKVLDCRAAAHEKLGWSKSALEDAKAVIKLRPELAKGYLRAARIYETLGKPDLALRLVQAGRAAVKTPDATLDKEETKLRAAVKQQAASPLSTLPRELFVQTVAYLSAAERYRCTRVCRAWRSAIESAPVLWDELILGGKPNKAAKKLAHYRDRLGDASLRSLRLDIELSRSRLAELDVLLNRLNGATEALEELSFVQPERSQDTYGDNVPVQWLDPLWRFIMARTATLRSLELRLRDVAVLPLSLGELAGAFSQLDRLIFKLELPAVFSTVRAGDEIFEHIEQTDQTAETRQVCNVRELRAESIFFRRPKAAATEPHFVATGVSLWDYDWPRLEKLTCTIDALRGSVSLPASAVPWLVQPAAGEGEAPSPLQLPALREIELRRGFAPRLPQLVSATRAPELRSALLTGFDGAPTHQMVATLNTHSPLLEVLSLSGCALLNNNAGLIDGPWLHLRELDISRTTFDDAAMSRTAELVPSLEVLNANSCTSLTGGPLVRLVNSRNGQLRALSIDACIFVKPDAVDWLKKVVPIFSARMGNQAESKSWRAKFT